MQLSKLDIFRRMGMMFRTDREEGRIHTKYSEADQETVLRNDTPQNPTFQETSTPAPIVGMTDEEMLAKGFRLKPSEGSQAEKKA